MNDQVQEVKEKTDIVSVISSYLELKKAGSNYKTTCPFHSEKTPSFNVSQELQIFKCFGCGKSGDVFTFLEEYEGMEFYEALKFLAEKAGVKLKPLSGFGKGNKERLYDINSYVLQFYRFVLLKHATGKTALNYLKRERGLMTETINTFNLGFSPNQPLALKSFVIDKKKVSVIELAKAGVVYAGAGRSVDRFRGRVIFPLFDVRGNLVGFAGRIIPGVGDKNLAKYINTPETEIYHKSKVLYGLDVTKNEIKKQNEAVIVEGELDLLSCWQVGIKNVVAIKGSALTEDQIKLLSRYTQKVILALDADFAGNEAAIRGIRLLEKEGFEIKVAKLTKFKDPDEAAKNDPDYLKNALKNARDVWDFVIDFVFSKYENESGGNIAKISRELTPLLAGIENKIVQGHYVNLVAKRLGAAEDMVLAEIAKIGKKILPVTSDLVQITNHDIAKSRYEILEERLLSIAFKYNPAPLAKKKIQKLFISPSSVNFLNAYERFTKVKKTFDVSKFAKRLPPELVQRFEDIILKDIKGLENIDDEAVEREMALVVAELTTLKLKNKLDMVAKKIREYENNNQTERLSKEQKRFFKLTKKLSELEAGKLKGIIL